MKNSFWRFVALMLTVVILFTACSSGNQIKRIKNHWNVPENEDIRVTMTNGDTFDFQKDEFKVFTELQVLKGLGNQIKPQKAKDISQVVIPLADIQTIEIRNDRSYQHLLTAGIVTGIGVLVYFLLKK